MKSLDPLSSNKTIMIQDPTKAEINLLKALKELDKAFTNDGGCIQIGLQTHLRNHDVGSYTSQVAKILIEQDIIKYDPKGTHKNPLIYYDRNDPPRMEMCREIFELIRSRKQINEARRSLLMKEIDLDEKKDFKIVMPDPDPKVDVIDEMKADVLKQLEYHSAEVLKYKTIYEYLNEQS